MSLFGLTWKVWAVIGVIVVLAWACGSQTEPSRTGGPGFAQLACEQKVKEQLRSPSTANFSGVTSSNSGAEWAVTGTVNAENALGGTIDHRFTCSLTWISGERYSGTATVIAR